MWRQAFDRRMQSRQLRLIVAIGTMAGMFLNPTVALAVAPNTPCRDSGFPSWFDGGPVSNTTAFPGASGADASINTIDSALCTTASDTVKGSLSWVGVGDANDGAGNSIYQVGIAKCKYTYTACDQVEHLFYAWGRTMGVDGCTLATHPPVPVSLGAAPAGTHDYTVLKTATQVQFKLDGVVKTTIGAGNICWPSTGVRFAGETWDRGDQVGGTVGVHQQISGALYYKSGTWFSPSFTTCTTEYLAEYICSRVNGQRVDIWSDRS